MDRNKASIVISSIVLTYFLLVTAFYIPYYDHSFWKDNTGFGDQSDSYEDFRTYLDEDYFGYDRLHLLSEFSQEEQRHMIDVKRIIDWLCILYYAAFLALLAFLLFSYHYMEYFRSALSQALLYGGGASLAFIMVIGVSSMADFNSFWNAFHKVLFPQGNWRFPNDSLLVSLFLRDDFFQEFAKKFTMIATFLSFASVGAGHYLKKITS